MKPFLVTIGAAILAFVATPCQAIDEAGAKRATREFLRALSPNTLWTDGDLTATRERAGLPTGPANYLWMIVTKKFLVTVDDRTGLVSSCDDNDVSSEISRGLPNPNGRGYFRERTVQRFSSESDAIVLARRAASQVAWTLGPEVRVDYWKPADTDGKTTRQRVVVMFSDRPHGYKATGIGNVVTISLDNKTGKVVNLFRFVGYSYEDPNVRVTGQQALEIARRAASSGEIDSMFGPRYVALSYRSAVGAQAQDMARNRIVPLAYVSRGKKYVAVSANDGTVLINEYRKAAGSTASPKSDLSGSAASGAQQATGRSSARRSESSPLTTAAWIGIPVVGIGLAAWLLRRRVA